MISQCFCAQPQLECVDNETTITLTGGKIDGEENFIARELKGLIKGLGQRSLFLDLRHVKGLSSAEVGTLVYLHKKLRAAGAQLTLVNVSAHLCDVFARIHLNAFLDIRQGNSHIRHCLEAAKGSNVESYPGNF